MAKWSLTIAHELVHGWLCYLGGHESLTPMDMKPPYYNNALRGESGRTWEIRAVGGQTGWRLAQDTKFLLHKPDVIRAGSLWLQFTKGGWQRMAKVTPEAMRDLAHGSTFPPDPWTPDHLWTP
jgi:hypothetical protein